jgi:hypothetical protein
MVRFSSVVVLLAALLTASPALGKGFVFGVKPSTVSPQNAYLGYILSDQLAVLVGLQFYSAGFEIDEGSSNDEWDDYDSGSYKLEASVWVPSVALKGYLRRPAEKTVVPYLYGSIFTLVPTASGEEELEDILDDTWDFGFSGAFGAEYFFHRQFSVGGEFGLNVLLGGYSRGGTDISGNVEATYAAFSMNFLL